jgi:hypothetical protein
MPFATHTHTYTLSLPLSLSLSLNTATRNLGKMDYAIASIKLCWGPMLELGKGCFWELFSPEWARFMSKGDKAPTRPSYCHPWADGVTPWLTHSLAGIVPLKPGYKTFAALPHVSQRSPNVSATHETPYGRIAVDAVRNTALGTVRVRVDAPVPGFVGLRSTDEATGCGLDESTFSVNGEAVAASPQPTIDAVHPTLAAQHHYIAVPVGVYTITAAFHSDCALYRTVPDVKVHGAVDGLPDSPPFPPAVYPGSWTVDTATRGKWINKYGKDGYVLFAYDQQIKAPSLGAKDLTKLPVWVNSVIIWKGSSAYVGRDITNASYLQDPRGDGAALGFVTKGADGSQGTVLDINVTVGTSYNVSLYMVSAVKPVGGSTWSFSKQAIRIMDLETLDPIAPDVLITHADGGVFWTLTYNRGVRLRVMPIDSDAGFSAVFFDRGT